MTIQQAVWSNKPFKRKWWHADYWCVLIGWDVYVEKEYLAAKAIHEKEGYSLKNCDIVWCMNKRYISMDDVMAEDWEIREEKIK